MKTPLTKGRPALVCNDRAVGCAIGRLEGDDRNRIKILDAGDVVMRGHHMILAQAVDASGKSIALKPLAGRTIRIEYSGVEKKQFTGALLLEVMSEP